MPLPRRILDGLTKPSTVLLCMVLLLAGCKAHKQPASSQKYPSEIVHEVKTKGSKYDCDTKVASNVIKEARKWLGTPYKYGGETRKGTDCSGFMMAVFRDAAGVKLPRDSRSQCKYCMPIDRKSLQPGDLVFFASKSGGSVVGHVGLYIGNNSIIHASSSRGVIINRLDETYYRNHYHSSGRVEGITYAATKGKRPNDRTELKIEEVKIPDALEASIDAAIDSIMGLDAQCE